MRSLVRLVPALACAVLVVGLTVLPGNIIRADVLNDAQMDALVGLCDCDSVILKDECKEIGCPGCKDATSCGGAVPIGTKAKHNLCTAGDTGVCKKDGERILCTEDYSCLREVEPEAGQKCNADKNGCIAGEASDNCILCKKGYEWGEASYTYRQSYKCE